MKFFFPLCSLEPGDRVFLARVDGIYLEEIMCNFGEHVYSGVEYSDGLEEELVRYWIARCKIQVVVESSCIEEALSIFDFFKVHLYIRGIAPFVSPMVSNCSFNDIFKKNEIIDRFVNINKLEYSLACAVKLSKDMYVLSGSCFINSVLDGKKYSKKYCNNNLILNIMRGVLSAPLIMQLGQSYLHIWSIIESVFPYISSEISFKLSLYIAHMSHCKNIKYYDVIRKSYSTRCKLSHGGTVKISNDDWLVAWRILLNIASNVLYNGGILDERSILERIFSNERYPM